MFRAAAASSASTAAARTGRQRPRGPVTTAAPKAAPRASEAAGFDFYICLFIQSIFDSIRIQGSAAAPTGRRRPVARTRRAVPVSTRAGAAVQACIPM